VANPGDPHEEAEEDGADGDDGDEDDEASDLELERGRLVFGAGGQGGDGTDHYYCMEYVHLELLGITRWYLI